MTEIQLSEKLGEQPTFPIFPESENIFFLKVVDAQIEFVKDAKGDATALVLHQGGRDQKAPRISNKAAVPATARTQEDTGTHTNSASSARKEIPVAPQVLARYAGMYKLAPGVDVTMTVEGGRLMTQITGQPKFELFAEFGDQVLPEGG